MQISRVYTDNNYAWMLRPNDAGWNTHYAYCWFTKDAKEQRHDLERLASKMDSFVIEFSAADVHDAASREGFEHLAPVGAQTQKRFAIALFDI